MDYKKMRIAYAENDKWQRSVVGSDLGIRYKCTIDSVENGQDLVDLVKTGNYNLVITDNDMPEMNGVQAIQQIRDDGYRGQIIMYSSGSFMDRRRALDAGANCAILKATTLDTLFEAIEGSH